MNTALWIAAGLLALIFLAAGGMKLSQPKEALKAKGMHWVDGVSPAMVKTLGALEVAGAIGLILPPLLGFATVLVPLAAVGLAITMIGAIIIHARDKEFPQVAVTVLIFALAVFVAVERFGSHAFSS